MKKLLTILFVSGSLLASAGILITPSTKLIYLDGDSSVTFNKVYLVEKVLYDASDSSVAISFTAYRKEGGKIFGVTDIPTAPQYYKVPKGELNVVKYALQQAKFCFIQLGYSATIQ